MTTDIHEDFREEFEASKTQTQLDTEKLKKKLADPNCSEQKRIKIRRLLERQEKELKQNGEEKSDE